MPKRHSRRQRGGLFGFGESSASDSSTGSWLSGLSSSASSWKDKIKNPFASSPSVVQPQQATTSMMSNPSAVGSAYGGKKSKKRRMRGGYSDNVSASSLAYNAASLTGGRRTRRHKSRRHSKRR
jgi:hypothetical protein